MCEKVSQTRYKNYCKSQGRVKFLKCKFNSWHRFSQKYFISWPYSVTWLQNGINTQQWLYLIWKVLVGRISPQDCNIFLKALWYDAKAIGIRSWNSSIDEGSQPYDRLRLSTSQGRRQLECQLLYSRAKVQNVIYSLEKKEWENLVVGTTTIDLIF